MTILLTGGLGYIGSHTAYYLLKGGHNVIILDSLVNSEISVLDKLTEITSNTPKFYIGDIRKGVNFDIIFENNDIDAVIHFAGLKSVNESMTDIDLYYDTNVKGTMKLLEGMKKYNVNRLIFSSSATVYGNATKYPVSESTPLKPSTNPYGRTKLMCENLIKDYCEFTDINSVILRYFNPIGSLPGGELFENPKSEALNIIPAIMKAINGKGKLMVFGDDYDTPDGTAIRDYIDINDLAEAHIKSLDIIDNKKSQIINIGSGEGYSVMEIIKAFKDVNVVFPYKIVDRRDGDIAKIYSNIKKAKRILKWEPTRTLNDSIKSLLK